MMVEVSELEEQLLVLLRGQDAPQFKVTFECTDGVWDVTLSVPPHDANHTARGTGATCGAAWENVEPLWA